MKNQQIHQQEKKISDLEKVVGSNKLGQTAKGEHTHTQAQIAMVRSFRHGRRYPKSCAAVWT